MRWFLLLAFGSIGLAIIGFGVRWGADDFLHRQAARGIVVQQEEERPDAMTVTYYPVVEFRDARGAVVRFKSVSGSRETPQYEQGAEVSVLYDPREPARARIGSFHDIWTGPAAAALLGFGILFLSLKLFTRIGRFERELASFGKGSPRSRPE